MFADTQSVKPLDLDKLEDLVNEKIQAATPVFITVYEEGDAELRKVSYNTDNARHSITKVKLSLCLTNEALQHEGV
jgi:hypothetical protein